MEIKAKLTRFNQIYKEMDIIYHNYAKSIGISDTAFWILYCISEKNGSFTQRELCKDWSFSPQTLNSALKDMEKRGLISLDPVPGNKKNKSLNLTQSGKKLCDETILPLMQAESESFSAISEEDFEKMMSSTEQYTKALRKNAEELSKDLKIKCK